MTAIAGLVNTSRIGYKPLRRRSMPKPKLSDAIRIGCKNIPKQCFTTNFVFDENRVLGPEQLSVVWAATAACAMGAAFSGGYRRDFDLSDTLPNGTHCPCDCLTMVERRPVEYCVMHLNDCHKWTRERIADWVQTVEEAYARQKAAAQALQHHWAAKDAAWQAEIGRGPAVPEAGDSAPVEEEALVMA